MLKKWYIERRERWRTALEKHRVDMRKLWWEETLWKAAHHYQQTEQFMKAYRVYKRLGEDELMGLALTAWLHTRLLAVFELGTIDEPLP